MDEMEIDDGGSDEESDEETDDTDDTSDFNPCYAYTCLILIVLITIA